MIDGKPDADLTNTRRGFTLGPMTHATEGGRMLAAGTLVYEVTRPYGISYWARKADVDRLRSYEPGQTVRAVLAEPGMLVSTLGAPDVTVPPDPWCAKPCRCPVRVTFTITREDEELDVEIHGALDAGDASVGVGPGAEVEHYVPAGVILTAEEEREARFQLGQAAGEHEEGLYEAEMEQRADAERDDPREYDYGDDD